MNKMVTTATSPVIMNVSTVYDNNNLYHVTLRKRKSSNWCNDIIVHPVEKDVVAAVATTTTTTSTTITLPPIASSVTQRQEQQQQQQQYTRMIYCRTTNHQTQCREIQIQQQQLRIPTSTTATIKTSRSGCTIVFPSFLRVMMVLLFLTTSSIYATPYNAVFQHGNMNSMNHDNHKKYEADRSQQQQQSSYTWIRNHINALKDEEISYDDDNNSIDDDGIISTPSERELYSYDDTYYSDIHFYSNDDDYATSSGSSNYNSKSTSTTKVLPSNIDWTSYALKYVSCANIKTWKSTTDNGSYNNNNYNDDSTTTENDILVQRTLVVVRLCPATLCSTYNVKGCNKDYGEYVLPASDYLQIIHTYYINQASIEKYCSVCSACMSYVTNPPTVSPTVSDNNNNGDDYYNRHARHLASNDDYFNDDAYGSSSYSKYKPWYLDDSYQCMYQNVCSKYMNKCKKYIENNNDDAGGGSSSTSTSATTTTMTNTTFGQCIAFRGDGGSSTDYYYYYAAPHCAADGRTLHVGLYADSNCTIYVKSTGSSNPFASYTSGLSCLSCNYYDSSESSYALIPDTAIIMQSASSSSSSTTNESSLSILSTNHPLCSNLYNISAHCNTKLTPFTNSNNNSTMSLSNYSSGEDNVVCPYIESLEDNMYDAYGDVILLKSSMYGMFSPFWRKGNGVYGTEEEMQSMSTNSPKHRTVELCILFLSMCIFCSLSIHAYTLRKKLLSRKFISWNTTATTENGSEKSLQQYPSVTNANYYTLFPWRYNTTKTNATNASMDTSIHRTDSGVAMTRSYEAPNYSLGSYDSENFIIPTTNISHRPVYQPYGGTIPQRLTLGTTTTTATAASSSSASVVRFQNHNDARTIQNIPSLEYMDRNTGRFA